MECKVFLWETFSPKHIKSNQKEDSVGKTYFFPLKRMTWGVGGVSGNWNKGEMKRHMVKYIGGAPQRKKQKEKILNILHYCHTK